MGVSKENKSGRIVINTDTGTCNLEIAIPPEENLNLAEQNWRKEFNFVINIAKKLGFTALSLVVTPRPIK